MKLKIFGMIVLATAANFGTGRAEEVSPPQSLSVVNALLDGQIAVVKLSDGRVIKKVKELEIGTEWTEWKVRGKESRVPTAEVVRVSLRGSRKTFSGMGFGALGVGLLLGAASGGSCENADFLEPCGTEGALGMGAVGAVLGAGLGALAGSVERKPGLEVYAGPLDQFLAKHNQNDSTLRFSSLLPPRKGETESGSDLGTVERKLPRLTRSFTPSAPVESTIAQGNRQGADSEEL